VHCGADHAAPTRRNSPEVADIVRRFGGVFCSAHNPTPEQRAALSDVERCRTARLGGHTDVCLSCGYEHPQYNSCRNRHCPKCQSIAQAKWVAQRSERMLPVHTFHLVFTLPSELRTLVMHNRGLLFDLLFASASDTLKTLARDPERLGAELGITMVLHTWTRQLQFHPHVHAIVTGGGLSLDGERWVPSSSKFLFPIQVMGKLFRGKYLDALEKLYNKGGLRIPDGFDFKAVKDALYKTDWIVYAKRPFGGTDQIIRYLGRYTHRVGISNDRIVTITDTHVTFRTKNGKCITVTGVEFLRRWVSHVLPRGYAKMRHYGLFASGKAKVKLARARALLETTTQKPPAPQREWTLEDTLRDYRDWMSELTGNDVGRCPRCGSGLVRRPLPTSLQPANARAPPEAA